MKRRGRQFFACVLALSMLFQQSEFQVLAEDQIELQSEADAQEVSEEVTVTPAEETVEPAEQEGEEPQEEEKPQEPESPQEPETPQEPESPQEPEQPENPEGPESPQQPENPGEEVPTVIPEVTVTEAPQVSPTQTPAPETGKTDFHYEDDSRIVIDAVAAPEALFPEDTQLRAEYLEPAGEAYKNAVASIEAQLGARLTDGQSELTLDYILYDVYFWSDTAGGRLEPAEGSVRVEMNFVKPVDMETKNPETQEQNYNVVKNEVVHLKEDGQAEIIDNAVIQTADDQITAAQFVQDSFSVMGIAWAKASTRDAEDVAEVKTFKLTGKNGIIDGAGDFDGNDERGNDSSGENLRVRSYDTIVYNVEATVESHDVEKTYETGRIGYKFSIPDDPELKLDENAMSWAEDWTEEVTGGNRVYTMCRNLPTTNGHAIPGGCTVNFVLDVGGKKEGDTVQPVITAWAEGNQTEKSITPDAVYVTSAPKFNIVLDKREISARNNYNFAGNAYNPDAGNVTGYQADYGFTIQMRNDDLNKGIRGTEMPDAGQEITFDLDMKSTFRADGDKSGVDITDEFTPLLYKINGNGFQGLDRNQYSNAVVWTLPMTWQRNGFDGKCCYESGTCTIRQEGSKLHVTISGFQIDKEKFPLSSVNGRDTYVTGNGKILAGCFATFCFSVIQPDKKDGQTILEKYNAGSGTVEIRMEDSNMQVTSVSGTTCTSQTVTADDQVTYERPLRSAGKYNHEIFYSARGKLTEGTNPDNKNDGSDSACLGGLLAFSTGYSESEVGSADVENHTVAFDQLVKFDDSAIEVDPSTPLSADRGNWKYTAQYVGKPGGWSSDEELKSAKEEDGLHYYDSYEALAASGDACVGMLFKFRGCNTDETSSSFLQMAQVNIKVKNTATIGSVAMITISTNAWLAKDIGADVVKEALGITEDSYELTLDDYRRYAQEFFDDNVPETHSYDNDRDNTYVKASYDETGYIGGETAGWDVGDSLYIVPYRTGISKLVEQTGNKGQKTTYDLDNGQRYVDFSIAGSMTFEQGMDVENPDWTTTVTIVDTLPAGLSYMEGSGYFGGEYTEQTPAQGSVTGGTSLTPQITKNEDGTTTLIWTLENVNVKNGNLPLIHYSCEIGNEVKDGQVLDTSANISTTEDKRKKTVTNGNLTSTSVTIIKKSSFNLSKTGSKSIEVDGEGNFALVINNSSEENQDNIYAIDTMPRNGVGSTRMQGNYVLTSLTLDIDALGGAEETADVEIYYTNDEAYIGKTAADVSLDTVRGWERAALDTSTGMITGENLIGKWPTAFAYVDASLKKMKTARISMEFQGDLGVGEDKLVNMLSLSVPGDDGKNENLVTAAVTDVYSRSLEGIAWLDENKDGGCDVGETLFANVTATLYKKNAAGEFEPYGDSVKTDENGKYRFDNLPEGEFEVVFTDESGEIFANRDVTKKKADGIADEVNSKADGNKASNAGVLTEGRITGIKMPSIEEMKEAGTKHYELKYQNIGLVEGKAEKKEETPGAGETVKVGDEITYTITGYNYNASEADVVITDKLDAGVDFVSAGDGVYDKENHTVVWTLKDVEAHTEVSVTLTVKVNAQAQAEHKVDNQAGVKVGNDAEVETNVITNPVSYKRSLEGTAWFDGDKDGLRTDKEETLENVTVTLYQKVDGEWKQTGEKVLTDDQGHYKFDNLDAGEYRVEFTASDKEPLDGYKLTKKDAAGDVDDENGLVKNNSKAAPADGETLKGVIEGITLPTDDELKTAGKTEYNLPYQDAGFINAKPVKTEETPGAGEIVKVGDEITYTIKGYNYNVSAADVVITDKLDEGVDFVSAGDGTYDKDSHTVVWTLKNVEAHTEVSVTLTVKVNAQAQAEHKVDNQAGVKVGNDAEVETNVITNPVSYKRSLEGTAWFDGDKDGLRTDKEETLENVTVTLYQKVDGEWKQTGEKVLTDDQGHYKFDNLDAGEYRVEFTASDKEPLDGYKLTKKDAAGDVDDENGLVKNNSKAAPADGETLKGVIEGITLPTDDELKTAGKTEYNLPYQDAGFINAKPVKTEETPGAGEIVKVGDEITYTIKGYNYNVSAADVVITDKLDEGVDFVSAGAGTYDKDSHTVVWILKNVEAHTEVSVTLTVKVNNNAGANGQVDNKAGVKVGNDAEVETNVITNPVSYKRSLEGTAWFDGDKDGLRTDKEETLENVTVTLYQKVDGEWKQTGEKVLTDDQGHYKFDNLDAGEYRVEFTASDKEPLDGYKLTKKDVAGDVDDENGLVKNNSKAAPADGETLKGVIEGITLPTDDELKTAGKTEYNLPYQDAGFINAKPVKTEETPGAGEIVKVGDEITYTIKGYNYNVSAVDVVITDKLDKGVDFVSAGAGIYDKDSHTVVWTLKNVEAHTEVSVTLTVKVNNNAGANGQVDNKAGVKVGNDAEVETNVITNPVSYKRSLEGTAWLDENKDGRRDDGEKLLENVPVTLYKVNEDGTRNEAGKTTTDKDGHYKFDNLEPGNYEVEFTTSEEVPFDDLKATKKEAAEDGVNSKIDAGKDDNGVLKGIITGITLPTDEELKEQGISEYNKPNQDAGFKEYHPVKAETTPGANKTVKVGDEITYTITGENYNAEKADVVITDKLDKGVDFVSAGDGTYDKDSHTVVWTLKDVEAHTEVSVTLTVKVNAQAQVEHKVDNQAGVKVGNDAEVETNVITNPVSYKRSLEGTAWFDGDKDGLRTDKEETLENVTVTLYQKVDGEWKQTGEKVLTDAQGHYKFDNLDAGEYRVEFTASDKEPLDGYKLTKKDVAGDVDDENGLVKNNSKAAPADGETLKGVIEGITLPTDDELKTAGKTEYNLPYQDAGFINAKPVKTEETPGAGEIVKVGDEITYTIKGYNYNVSAADVVITDKLDKGVDLVSAGEGANAGTYDKDTHTVTWILKDVAAHTEVAVTLTVKVNNNAGANGQVDNKAGVKVGNDAEVETNVITNPVSYKRSLEGTAWLDENRDGRRDDGEKLLENVPVTLYKVNEDGTRTEAGKTTTDKDGHYKFDNLEPGNYEVEFTTSEDVPFDDLKATKKEAAEDGVNSKIDAGKDGNGILKGVIIGITLPTDEELKEQGISEYNKPNQDAGFKEYHPVKAETTPGANETVKVGDEITYTITGENYNAEKADVVITDKLDKGVDFVSAGDGTYDKDTHTVVWTLKNVAAHTEVSVTLTVKVNNNAGAKGQVDNKASVKVGNDAEVETNVITNPVNYKRSLEGTAWLDENRDGRRDDGEKLLENVPVTLYKVNEDGTRTEAGKTTTDKDGHYKFDNLEPGAYEVEFTTSEDVPFDDLKATKKEAAEDGVNSKIDAGKDDNGILKGIITGITLPTDEELKEQGISEYNKPNQDAGFKEYHPVKAETTPGANETVKVGDEITYTIKGENYNAEKADVVITDKLDKGVDFVSAGEGENAGLYDKKTHTVTWSLKAVAAHTEVTVTLKVRVNIDAAASGKVVNQASVKVGNDAEIKTNVIENPVTPNEKGTGSITVEKYVKQDEKYIALEEYSFYTALFSDEALTQRATDVKELKVTQSYKASVTFEELPLNKTYYVAETDAEGNAVSGGDGIIQKIEIQNQKITLTPEKALEKSAIINTVAGFPDNYYNDGTVTINKKVLVNNKKANVTDTFWFTIFADAEMNIPVTTVSLELNEESSGQLIISNVPFGTFYFAETDKDGKPVDDSYEYEVQVNKKEITLDAENKNAVVNVVNAKEVEVTPTVTPTETPENTPIPSSTPTTTTGVKTGDNTPIALYAVLLFAALVVMEEILRRRSKKEQR